MRSSSAVLSLVTLLTSTVRAHDYLTTVEPCLAAPTGHRPHAITVTKQLQPVSYCKPTTVCTTKTEGYEAKATCGVIFPYYESLWISSVIPLPYGEGKCTVTDTEQSVTVQEYSSKVTHYTTITPHPVVYKLHTNHTTTKIAEPYKKVQSVDVVVIDYITPFKSLGPHAIPGYPGSGLCHDCKPNKDGSAHQVVDVRKCINDECTEYAETWAYDAPKKTSSVNRRHCTTSKVVSTPGTYTITVVPETCKTVSVHGPTTIVYPETSLVCHSKGVYTATITPEVCHTTHVSPHHGQHTTIHVDTTITKTYHYTTTVCNTHKPSHIPSYTHRPHSSSHHHSSHTSSSHHSSHTSTHPHHSSSSHHHHSSSHRPS